MIYHLFQMQFFLYYLLISKPSIRKQLSINKIYNSKLSLSYLLYQSNLFQILINSLLKEDYYILFLIFKLILVLFNEFKKCIY